MQYENAVKVVLGLEGGDRLVDHPKDPGGLTKFGISLRAYPDLGRQGILDLTEEKAIELYRREYWDAVGADSLPERLRLAVFDTAVNHGPEMAGKLLQQALVRMGAKLHVDGEIGPRTRAAVKNYKPERVLSALLSERLRCYKRLEGYKTFGPGWEKRIIEIAISS